MTMQNQKTAFSVSEEMQDFYELVDGEQYSEEYGLDFSLEDGMAFFV